MVYDPLYKLRRLFVKNPHLYKFYLIAITIYIIIVVFYGYNTFFSHQQTKKNEENLKFYLETADVQKKLDSLKSMIKKFKINNYATKNINPSDARFVATIQLDSLKNRINRVESFNLGLRQAINPLKPNEVLTIARLQDEVTSLIKENKSLVDRLKDQQSKFEDSVKRELDASTKNLYLIYAVLAPLIFNFLTSIWGNFKQNSKDQTG